MSITGSYSSRTPARPCTATAAILLMFSLLMMALAVVPGTAQYQWERQEPFSVGNDLKSVTFADPVTGFAVGKGGTILRTTDGGATWEKIDSGTDATLNCIYITQDQRQFIGLIGCSDGNILRSTDWGNTWQPVTIHDNRGHAIFAISRMKDGSFLAVGANKNFFTSSYPGTWWYSGKGYPNRWNSLRGIATAGSNTIAVGTYGFIGFYNKGWQQVQSPAGIANLYSVSFKGSVGYICGESGTILKSIDNGNSWQKLTTGSDTRLTSLSMLDENTVCAVGDEGTVLFTYNGGTTWTRRNIDTDVGFTSVCFSSPTSGHIVGDRGVTAITTDGGINWKTSLPVRGEKYVDTSFADPNVGWVLDSNGNLINTIDGGRSWNLRIPASASTINKVHAVNPDLAYVCGSGGMVLRTTTGGLKWMAVQTSTQADLNSIAGFIGGPVIAVGSRGTIVRSTGIGLKMKAVSSGVTSDLVDICMMDPLNGWVISRDGAILKTVDDGVTWVNVNFKPLWGMNPDYELYAVTAQGSNVIISGRATQKGPGSPPVLIDYPFIFRSIDSGATWQFAASGIPALCRLAFYGNQLVGVGEGSSIWISTNYGTSWTPTLLDGCLGLSAFSFTGNFGYAVGDTGCIFRTSDGGVNWQRVRYRPSGELHGMAFADDLYGWAAGDNGVVLRTVDGGTNWKPIDTGWTSVFKSIDCFGHDYAWMISGNCLYSTVDAGGSWNRTQIRLIEMQIPIPWELNCVDFIDPNIGWLGARGGNVFSTVDGGYSWQCSNIGTGPYSQQSDPALRVKKEVKSLSFVNPTTGWAAGADGLLAKTTDGGHYWTVQKDPASVNLTGVTVKDGVCYSVSMDGYFTRCLVADADSTALQMNIPVNLTKPQLFSLGLDDKHDYNAVQFIDPLHGWAVGDNGRIISTQDGGENWTWKFTGLNSSLKAIKMLDSMRGIAAGDDGVVLVTTDGGENWTLTDAGTADDILCIGAGKTKTWIAGENGTMVVGY